MVASGRATHYKASDNGILPNNPNTWIPYSSTITKTIYDPCPYGYRVPINGSWTGFPKNTWTLYAITGGTSWPADNGGWWPAAGIRLNSSSIFINAGCDGRYWSSSRHTSLINNGAFGLYFYYSGIVHPTGSHSRSDGYSVRCIEE